MGGFTQALTAGIADTGEDIGKGLNANREEDTRNALAASQIQNMSNENLSRNRQLDIEQAGQQQQLTLATHAQELERQAMEQQGWENLGALREKDGTYSRVYQNVNSGKQMKFSLPSPPPDSFEYQNSVYKQLKQQFPNFTDQDAAGIAYRVPALIRQDPAQLYQDFYNLGPRVSPKKDPRVFAQNMMDLIYGRGSYIRAQYGGWPGNNSNSAGYGFTANEGRLFNAQTASIKNQMVAADRAYSIQLSQMIDPSSPAIGPQGQLLTNPDGTPMTMAQQANMVYQQQVSGMQQQQDTIAQRILDARKGAKGAGAPAIGSPSNPDVNVKSGPSGSGSTGSDRAKVIRPDGQVGYVPRAQLSEAIKQGYKSAE